MKIGIIGDTHGNKDSLEIIMDCFPEVDFFIHTGDHWQDGQFMEQKWKVPVLSVRGNCDPPDVPQELNFILEGKRFYVTHGHGYSVKSGLYKLYCRACELQADFCIYGHTHLADIQKMDGIIFLNPGSLTWPRGGKKYAGIFLDYNKKRFQPYLINTDSTRTPLSLT